jgi:putative ABC transport system permease protein
VRGFAHAPSVRPLSEPDPLAGRVVPAARRMTHVSQFGGLMSLRSVTLRAVMLAIMEEVRFAIRSLVKSPGFTLLAVLILAVGIGANTAIFSVVNAVVLRPLSVQDSESVVRFLTTTGASTPVAGVQQYETWRRQTVFEHVSAHRLEYVNLTGQAEPEQIPVARVTRDFFQLFRAPVLTGRTFTAVEDRPGGPHVAVLSYELWARRFHSDPAVIRQRISLGTVPHDVVGVLAPRFDTEQFDTEPGVWVPFQIDPQRVDGGNLFTVTGRLQRGVSVMEANASLAVAVAVYRRDSPGVVSARTTWSVQPLREAMIGNVRSSLNLLFGAVGFLLLIACANVANLLLVRADIRTREMAIRTALGASRRRILSQVLTEAVLLSLVSGLAGLLVGTFGVRTLLTMYSSSNPYKLGSFSDGIPRLGSDAAAVTIDWRVFTFTIVVCFSTAIAFGLWPALRLARVDVVAAMKRVTGGLGRRQTRMRAGLVIVEIALALTLLVGATLFIRSSVALRAIDAGFDPNGVITMRTSVTATRFETRAGLTELTHDAMAQLRGVPGVVSVSATCCMPLETVWQLPFVVEGRPPETLTRNGRLAYSGFAGWTFVAPEYFDVLKIPIVRGRDFTDRDGAGAPGVVIINEEMARRFWPTSDPLNDRLIVGRGMRPEYDQEPVRQIVGIVGNVRDTGLTRPPRPEMYVPVAQEPDGVTVLNVRLLPVVWLARTSINPLAVAPEMARTLERVSGLPAARVRSMDQIISESTARSRFDTWLMTIFGTCALLLAAIGVYGLMAYVVQQRTGEIGIRMALGADSRRIQSMVLKHGAGIAFAGAVIGLIASWWLARLIAGLLFEVSPHDPAVFVSVPSVLAGLALVAAWIPACRATRVDPVVALRAE